MRILFVSLLLPFPPSNGRRLRNWGLLSGLAAEGHQVTLIAFCEPHEQTVVEPELRQTCANLELVTAPSRRNGVLGTSWGRLRALASSQPYGAWRLQSAELTRRIQHWLGAEDFDLLVCDDIYITANLPPDIPVPVVLNKHDLTHVIMHRYLAYERNPLIRMYGRIEQWKTRRWEALACSRVSRMIVCSEVDRKELERLCPGTAAFIVPNVIDTDNYVTAPAGHDSTVIYFGALDWLPNRDAVEFFLREILPLLRIWNPGVKFVVAGRNPPEAFGRLCSGLLGVEIAADVPDIRTEIAKAAVCVVPLRIGSGTRLKILEAAAMAKSIVSTRLGAEGLDFQDGEEIVLVDKPQAFARAVADLLANESRRQSLGRAARRRVEHDYNLPALRLALRRALDVSRQPWAKVK